MVTIILFYIMDNKIKVFTVRDYVYLKLEVVSITGPRRSEFKAEEKVGEAPTHWSEKVLCSLLLSSRGTRLINLGTH